MASEETSTTIEDERYLYLYCYTIEDKSYNWFGYFRNYQEAETTILFLMLASLTLEALV